jgi:hypothetical protein
VVLEESGRVSTTATAQGGAGQSATQAGDAHALSWATAENGATTSTATATAVAVGGFVGFIPLVGPADADARAETGLGQAARATATASGALASAFAKAETFLLAPSSSIDLTTYADAGGVGNENLLALVSSAATGGANQFANYDSYGVATGATIFLGNNVATVFGATGATVFGSAALGGNYDAAATGAQTYDSNVEWEVDTNYLTPGGPLDLGFVDAVATGAGFGGIKVSVLENTKAVFSFAAGTLAAANAEFTDKVAKLGIWKAAADDEVFLEIRVAVTLTAANSGFGVDLVAGLGGKTPGPELAATGTSVRVTAANASGAALNGPAGGGTVLEIVDGGTAAMNAATDNVTVQLDAATHLKLNGMSHIIAIGSAAADTIVAGAAGQTLTGGAGHDTLVGWSGGGDLFRDTASGLNGDTIVNLAAGGRIDLTDLGFPGASLGYDATTGTLHVAGGATEADILVGGGLQASAFHLASDGGGGTLVQYGHG